MLPSSVVVVGASAGGVEALSRLVSALPDDLAAAVLVVLHITPDAPSMLARILGRSTHLPVSVAVHGAPIEDGHVYVAPPDRHLLVTDGRMALVKGPRENGVRPAVDPLFRSAARAHGRDVIGVVLSGNLGDGAHGLAEIKAHGGAALVQAPAEALHSGMPLAAIDYAEVDEVLPLAELAEAIVRRVGVLQRNGERRRAAVTAAVGRGTSPALRERVVERHGTTEGTVNDASRESRDEVDLDGVAAAGAGQVENEALGGQVSPYTCPECNGTLWEIRDGMPVRFRCRVGHSYSAPALVHQKSDRLEAALWTALTALEENASLAKRLAERSTRAGRHLATDRMLRRVRMLEERAATVREVLGALPDEPTTGELLDDELAATLDDVPMSAAPSQDAVR